MKVLFQYKSNTVTITNVSVDDKCYPLVGGIHPFSAASKSKSPLALESSLWFKTLAVDSIYIDCDSSLIFWSPITNDHIPESVILRKKESAQSFRNDFVPENAKALVSDLALFDFDASYKEMMVKCHEVAKKLFNKSVSVNDVVANLLHVYILPSIHFSSDDLYALSRARCLIEERHLKADTEISAKAQAINLLQTSLDNLKDSLLYKDNFESENYLRTCNRTFLKTFLKKIEYDSIKSNLDLEAQQSKVNWAKEQNYEKEKIVELQKRRDALFIEVEKLIKVREALKNVVTRKLKTKKKQARQGIIDSCFHNVFMEILRRLDIENKTMEQLVEVKLNISAAREAIMSVIMEFNEQNRAGSERSTRFEPFSFGDYHPDCSVQTEKSDAWLTLQERASKALKDTLSAVHIAHVTGCRNIQSRINLALSEFHMHEQRRQSVSTERGQSEDLVESSIDIDSDPRKRRSTNSLSQRSDRSEGLEQEADVNSLKKELKKEYNETQEETLNSVESDRSTSANSETEIQLRSLLKPRTLSETDRRSGQVFPTAQHASPDLENTPEEDRRDREYQEEFVLISPIEASEMPAIGHSANNNKFISENLAINTLMAAVDNIKSIIHEHFREVIKHLQERLNLESGDSFEILWKAYERHFSEEILEDLSILYNSMLQPGSKDVYKEIRRTSLQDLLEGDKILDLFFMPGRHQDEELSGDDRRTGLDAVSMALTFSNLSLDVRQCSLNELYKLANADSNDLSRRFNLDAGDHQCAEDIAGSPSSSESGASVKTADLFDDEDEGIEERVSDSTTFSSESTAAESKTDGNTSSENKLSVSVAFDEDEHERKDDHISLERKLHCSDIGSDTLSEASVFLSPHEIVDLMDPVLSPFRKQITKCVNARSVLDKMRYLSKAVQGLNNDISQLYGADHVSACDDIISMLVLSLANMPEGVFVGLYSNLRLLMDICPSFLSGSLCDFNLVCLCAAYDYLLSRNVCKRVVQRYAASFKVKITHSISSDF